MTGGVKTVSLSSVLEIFTAGSLKTEKDLFEAWSSRAQGNGSPESGRGLISTGLVGFSDNFVA